MNDEDTKEAKERLHTMIDDADNGEVEAVISALHMGQQVTALIRAAAENALDSEEIAAIAVTFVTHKVTGKNFSISVQQVTDEAIAKFEADAGAGCGHTRH